MCICLTDASYCTARLGPGEEDWVIVVYLLGYKIYKKINDGDWFQDLSGIKYTFYAHLDQGTFTSLYRRFPKAVIMHRDTNQIFSIVI